MKIAVISDIHSNLEALKTTLEDIKQRKVDKIICLGDIIAKGIHAKECVKLIKENCDIVLQGNCDTIFDLKQEKVSEIVEKRIEWNKSMLSEEEQQYLQNLPFSYEMYLSGSLVRFFHASPTVNDFAFIHYASPEEKWKNFLPSTKTISQEIADVVVHGHIHEASMEKLYHRTIINVGSVGNAWELFQEDSRKGKTMETTRCQYVIIEGKEGDKQYKEPISYEFINVCYDIEKELENQENNIEREKYVTELQQGQYRDMQKIEKIFQKLDIKRKERK